MLEQILVGGVYIIIIGWAMISTFKEEAEKENKNRREK